MKPQNQRWFRGPVFDADGEQTDEGGDCFSACLASLLDVDLQDFPNFLSGGKDPENENYWWNKWNTYLYDKYRQTLVYYEEFDKQQTKYLAYWIAEVTIDDTAHCVIFHADKFVWDPAPDDEKQVYTLADVKSQVFVISITNLLTDV